MQNSTKNYINLFNFNSEEFQCYPYNSEDRLHSFGFMDTEITDLFSSQESIDESKIYFPDPEDTSWRGCFCYLDEKKLSLFSKDSILAVKWPSPFHVKMINTSEVVWVRNIEPTEGVPFYSAITKSVEIENNTYDYVDNSSFHSYCWVKMRVDLVLERARLWKKQHGTLPDSLLECYIMESQTKSLIELPYIEQLKMSVRSWIQSVKNKLS